ncbi:MAG: transcriptional regulator [Candidatus Terrybacteria bacterium RIFCSPLOWO2_01_FULL_44_24]|uniref:Probable transcriptional regulatory protein A2828_02015 n=1 Tax=Candidatus Terrybacteria bacterium RIFCSPHIGHO2_01_FULL_43_35 TaxID=1802361 RepID=A0A1G2PE99_9BACT|nr:MAG: transcriptional regulator [Candidatus Terrybacteria bacterium RIFCSPHIGHO2_01_FULL_43_35]OHA50896.1 MAG: transcriptional regulator [Candidatus Terrybacteria bacterium RIFCSPLOWO2_01_FULL_44_24]
MSGHSKWSTIKHQKESQDKKRGQIFSKLARAISIAAKDGADPDKNARLRMEMEKARKFNMPKDNVTRAIERGNGATDGTALESFTYDAYGPGGVALIIEGISDNRNRTAAEIKRILADHGGKMAGEGSVNWMFSRSGIIRTSLPEAASAKKEALYLDIISAGAEDIMEAVNGLNIMVPVENMEAVKKTLYDYNIEIDVVSTEWVPKNRVVVAEDDKKPLERLFEALDEHDDVQEIYSNMKE